MQTKAILVITMLITACVKPQDNAEILWGESNKLPAEGSQVNPGVAGPVVGVINGQLLIAGGANFPDGLPWEGGKKAYQRSAYLYTISDNQLHLNSEFALSEGFAYSANYSDGDCLYSAGGEDEEGAIDQVYAYRLNDENRLIRDTLAHLPMNLTNGGLVAIDNHLYFIGGENSEMVSDKIYFLDFNGEEVGWKNYLSLPYPISNAVVVSNKKDKIYIAGGRKKNLNAKSDIYDELLEIDIPSRTIASIAKLPRALAAGSGVYFQDQIILFGGDDASTFHQVEDALAKIGTTSDQTKKDSLIAAKNQLQVKHPGFRKEVISFDIKNKQWKELGQIPDLSPVTTTAVLNDHLIIIPSGEIRAGVRTDQILVGTIK